MLHLVELHPSSANSSSAFGTTGLNQVGVVDSHAALWSGTAGSFIDLNPAGATDSKAYAVSGSHQAGYVWIGSGQHAAIWSGTAISFVDLHSVLGANYSRSCAKGIWSEGRTTYVAGFADSDAVLWTIRDMHVYVNHSYAGTSSDGSLQTPFKTVTAGYQSVQTNGLITVFSGNYNESVHMDKPLVLSATNGTVNIIGLP